ncbi:hypothetical protein HanRHA438_Chr04g0195411 [Helianthus annuus]|nr:hypothetical protein HanRHA438_Chr04g0195411 [Helianthus annuus]
MMSRMLLSSSCVLLFLLCLSHECNGRHLNTLMDDDHAIDNKAKLLNHNSTIKGFGDNLMTTVHDDLNLKRAAKEKKNKQTYGGSKNKKDKTKGQTYGRRQRLHQHHPKSVTFRVPPKNKRVHQQPGFNLDYSPPKTHPPSHN